MQVSKAQQVQSQNGGMLAQRPVFQQLVKPVLTLALSLLTGFSALAMAATPNLPDEFKQDAKGRMVLLDFYSAFCGTCQMMEPHVKALAARVNHDVLLERVDLGQQSGAKYLDLFSVEGTPTYVLFDPQGKPIYRMGDMITPVVLERQVLRLTGQLKSVSLPATFSLPTPASTPENPLGQMILLSFESQSCPECQSMTPYLDGFELAGKQGLHVVHLNMDTPEGKQLMDRWAIKTLPAYMLLDNSQKNTSTDARPELFRISGKMDPKALWEVIRMFGDAGV